MAKISKNKNIIIPVIFVAVYLLGAGILDLFLIGGTHYSLFRIPEEGAESVEFVLDDTTVAEITDIQFPYYPGTAFVFIKSLKEGTTNLRSIQHTPDGDVELACKKIKVGHFGIIVENDDIGNISNMHIINIELIILILILLIYSIVMLVTELKKSMYSYLAMYYLGFAIFLTGTLVIWLFLTIGDTLSVNASITYIKLWMLFDDIINVFSRFLALALPFIFLLSVFLIFSNIILLTKESRRLSNALGIGLGVFLIVLIALPVLYDYIVPKADSRLVKHIVLFFSQAIYFLESYLFCILVSATFCTVWAQRRVPPFDRDYMIILGCGIRKDGTPTPLLKGRIDRAMWFDKKQMAATGKKLTYIVSGGKGGDEVISEAESMKTYLVECGIPKERIIMEDKSTSTYENMRNSYHIIREINPDAKIAFSTTEYHVFRSGYLAERIGMKAVGMGSRTKLYFYVNAWIREFVANMKNQQGSHIRNIAVVIVALIILTVISYVFNLK